MCITSLPLLSLSFLSSTATIMKLEDYLMELKNEQRKRLVLEEEVAMLEEELDRQENLHRVLQSAVTGPVQLESSVSSSIPSHVQGLLMEVSMVEEEIVWLERKFEKLEVNLYEERKVTRELEMQQQEWKLMQQNHSSARRRGPRRDVEDSQHKQEDFKMHKMIRERRSKGFASDSRSMSLPTSSEGSVERLKRHDSQIQYPNHLDSQSKVETPNDLSEDLIKCFISIYLKINQVSLDTEGSFGTKLTLPCMKSKSSSLKSLSNCKPPIVPFNNNASYNGPYDNLQEPDGTVRYIDTSCKNFIQITRKTVDMSRVSECVPAMKTLSLLMSKLCKVDLTFLTNKQKLAFWINIYNACIMHAFLHHGLPSTQGKLLALMNKAAMNVGGIVLNALAIEHFILRHPCDSTSGAVDEKEMLLRHAYGLGYPEPDVTFALCRGSWSSPALRVYTPDEVVNELERAKVEYLEASVGVTSKKRILVPKLLQWHMRDFAENMESLVEWIYSQLPQSGTLKRSMMECLNGQTYSPITKMVEIQPYKSDFRYLLPV